MIGVAQPAAPEPVGRPSSAAAGWASVTPQPAA